MIETVEEIEQLRLEIFNAEMHQGGQVLISLFRIRKQSISSFTSSRRWKDYL